MNRLRWRIHLVALVALTVAALVHHAVLWGWFIEDAAISFAFARNLANGEGLVPWVGGARVEGYSNPTWVAVLALCELVGFSAEFAARWVQAALVALCVPLTWLIAREAAPREDSEVPLLAAGFLAGFAQFAIWTVSGLENALFNTLLALALWRLLVEGREGGRPWSAWWFFLLAITRPEALLYAAIGGGCSLVFGVAAGRGLRPIVGWLALFWGPFLGYHAARYAYFAYPLPQTYYAKLSEREPKPFAWDRAGWLYLRNWLHDVKISAYVPVALLGVTGGSGARALAGVAVGWGICSAALLATDQTLLGPLWLATTYALFAGAMIRFLPPEAQRGPLWAGLILAGAFLLSWGLLVLRGNGTNLPAAGLAPMVPWIAVSGSLVLPLLAVGGRGWQARVACWGMVCASVFFATFALGDWMRGFRWFSLMSVPLAVLLGSGAGALADMVQRVVGVRRTSGWSAPGYAVAVLLLAAWVPPNVAHTRWFDGKRETSPFHVRARVRYIDSVADRLLLERPFGNLDVDQGAHLWWSDHRMLDIAGLIDVPFAQHHHAKAFVREYLFEENRPAFAHVHDHWARKSQIPQHPEWSQQYFEIPGFGSGKFLHVGNHLRRDLVFPPDPPEWATGPEVAFGEVATLVGWRVPSPEVRASGKVVLEIAVKAGPARRDFRLLAFGTRDAEVVAVWDLPMAYDWLAPSRWGAGDLFVGRYLLPVPETPGPIALGFAVFDFRGVVPADVPPADAPRFAVGEMHFSQGGPEVVPPADADRAIELDLEAALAAASETRCDQAETGWWLARMHVPLAEDAPWRSRSPEVRAALARCRVAEAAAHPERAAELLARAQLLDHWEPSYRAAAAVFADAREAEGQRARAEGRWDDAYRAFADAVAVLPTRAWARRYAEEARSARLGLLDGAAPDRTGPPDDF